MRFPWTKTPPQPKPPDKGYDEIDAAIEHEQEVAHELAEDLRETINKQVDLWEAHKANDAQQKGTE